MSFINLDNISPGFNIQSNSRMDPKNEAGKKNRNLWNITNVMDYIPGVSIISGIARIILFSVLLLNADKSDQRFEKFEKKAKAQIVRGVVSALCLSIIFAPFDLYATFSSPKSEN